MKQLFEIEQVQTTDARFTFFITVTCVFKPKFSKTVEPALWLFKKVI
jgi:hypothetical protein